MTTLNQGSVRSTRSDDEPDLNLTDVLRVVWRRAWWLGASIALFVVLAGLYLMVAKKRYQADSELQLLSQGPSSNISNLSPTDSDTSALQLSVTMQTYVGILTSDRLALQVIDELRLEDRPEFHVAPAKQEVNRPLANAPRRRAEVLKRFEKQLTVSGGSGSRLLNVSFRSTSPEVATLVLDRLIQDFIAYNQNVRHSGSVQTETALGKQLDDLQRQVQSKEQAAQQAEQGTDVYGTDAGHNLAVARLETLQTQLASAEQNRIVKASVNDQIRAGGADSLANLANEPGQSVAPGGIDSLAPLNTLRARETELTVQEVELSSKYGSEFPPLVSVKRQLAAVRQSMTAERKRLALSAAGNLQIAVNLENQVRDEVEKQTALANQSNDSAMRYLIANREATATRDLYEHLLGRSQELGVVAGLSMEDLEVVDPAHVDPSAKPDDLMTLLEGLGAGLVFGLCAVFLLDSMDRTLYAPDLAQKLSGLPLLGVIPLAKNKQAELDPDVTEAFRFVKAAAFVSPPFPLKVVMVTSAAAGDGKSFTALNMALILARAGHSTLIVDADQRTRGLTRHLSLAAKPGLADMLSANSNLDRSDYLQTIETGVKVLPAGNVALAHAELLASKAMASMLAEWREKYDYILITTAPLESASDGLMLAPAVDGVVVVSRANVTGKTSFALACERLKSIEAPLLGTIFNAMPRKSSEYQYYAGRKGSR